MVNLWGLAFQEAFTMISQLALEHVRVMAGVCVKSHAC